MKKQHNNIVVMHFRNEWNTQQKKTTVKPKTENGSTMMSRKWR